MDLLMETTQILMEIIVFFIGVSGCILIKINKVQSVPYMDEIFHIPQAQKYCNGQFLEWDPMITTLPGLYLSSVGILRPINWLFGVPMKLACSIIWLRCQNIVYAAGNLYLMYLLTKKVHKDTKDFQETRCILNAAVLSVFPVLYFFTFLYYTDPGSTFFVLLMYLLSLHDKSLMASGIGVIAVLFRQTNIIWVMFVAGLAVSRVLIEAIQPEKKDIPEESLQNFGFLILLSKQILRSLRTGRASLKRLISNVLKCAFPFVVVGLGFATFVVWNGSIVVGAKGDHQAALNFPQLFYFVSFTAAFSLPHLLSASKVLTFVNFVVKNVIKVFVIAAVSAILIWKFTYVHRYLLADNRHYTFYIWSKIYSQHDLVRYILIPGYIFAAWLIVTALQSKDIFWKLTYLLCITLNLIPATLLEFRYFIIPYLVFRLNIPIPSYSRLFFEACVYIVVNVATIYLFLQKPFQWGTDPESQRFMW